MISFIRRFLESKLVMALFAAILLAFLLTGWGTGSGGLSNLAGGGSTIAKVGSLTLSSDEAASRIQAEFALARQQQPGLPMSAFDAQGGIDQALDRMINAKSLLAFADKHGMVVSERLIDSKILTTPAFYGPAGKFDRNTYLNVLGQRRMSEGDHRLETKAQILADEIIPSATGAARAPKELLTPYASLLLEHRFGQIAVIPSSRFMGAAPTEAETKAYYDHNIARYTVPETRVIRYALFDKARFEGKVTPTEEDIATAYKADSEKYAATERRTLTQVILSTEAAAKTLAAKIKGGTSIIAAAKEAGLDATTLDPQDKKTFASLSSPAAADAAFAARDGAITDPAKSGLGWHVIKVDKVNNSSGKTLEQARSEIIAKLTPRKVQDALADMVVRIEDAIDDGSTFDDEAKKEGLIIVTTPALTASGVAPDQPGYKVSAELVPILTDAFQSEPGDDASVVTIKANERDALLKLDKINPATPKPLTEIHAQVAAEAQADRAAKAARKAATDLVAIVNGGKPLPAALAAASFPAASPLSGQRLDVAKAKDKAPPALAALFKLAQRKAKMIEASDKKSFAVIWLDRLEAGNAAAHPDLIAATQGDMAQLLGDEYAQQFLLAMKADVGFQRNEANIIALKKSLRGGTAAQ